ncbi:MAG: hypothetical protein HQ541_01295 [Mariniphaga sp.]|nr:hypothetical protein [Mariniphaga sp.]
MKTLYSLLFLIVILIVSSCDLIFPDEEKKEDTEAVPAGRILLNFLYNNVEFKYVYNDGSNDIYGAGGQNGNFDSDYGTSVSKTENGVKVMIGAIDRVMPFGETVKADLKLVFNDDELLIRELEFEKTSTKNNTEEWILKARDIIKFDEDDVKIVYKISGTDVCSNSTDFQYKLITSSYTETVSDWNKCLANDASHITIEIYK